MFPAKFKYPGSFTYNNGFKHLFILILFVLILFSSGFVSAGQSTQAFKTESVRLLCDFKNTTPNFYDIKDKKLKKRDDVGLEEITPLLNKFVAKKIISTSSGEYVWGYFLSIHDVTGKIAPNPIGEAYVKLIDMYCLSVDNLF